MEDHFNRLLDAGGNSSGGALFVPSGGKFIGARKGYAFKNGSSGVGYYLDKISSKTENRSSAIESTENISKKRKLDLNG